MTLSWRTFHASYCALLALMGHALAFCSEPSFTAVEPTAPFSRPSVPYCLEEYSWSGRHSCEGYELDAYFSEVQQYIDELQSYVDEAVDLANTAIRFANDAQDFAQCEADEVNNQHR